MTAERRERHKKSSALPALAEKLRANEETKKYRLVTAPPGQAKISDAIKELIRPFFGKAKTLPEYENLVAVGCIAWNTALRPRNEWEETIGMKVAKLPGATDELYQDLLKFILLLAAKKVELFPDNQRLILTYKVTETQNNFHIAIASQLEHSES